MYKADSGMTVHLLLSSSCLHTSLFALPLPLNVTLIIPLIASLVISLDGVGVGVPWVVLVLVGCCRSFHVSSCILHGADPAALNEVDHILLARTPAKELMPYAMMIPVSRSCVSASHLYPLSAPPAGSQLPFPTASSSSSSFPYPIRSVGGLKQAYRRCRKATLASL